MKAERESRTSGPRDAGRLPTFLIIGAMRSGTTSLTNYLRPHPEVFMPEKKELHFFDVNYDKGLAWYARQFRGAGDRPAVGEATATYLYDEASMRRIAEAMPDVRLVAILRDPVDRAYSHYWLNRARGHENLGFEAATEAEEGRLATADLATRIGKSYLDRGRYLEQLRRATEHFPRESLHVIILEHLRDEPERVYAELCRFLSVDDTVRPDNLGQQLGGFVRFRSLFLFRFNRLLFRQNRSMPRRIARIVRKANVKEESYPAMDPELRQRLLRGFAEHNAELAAWLGRDLSAWQR